MLHLMWLMLLSVSGSFLFCRYSREVPSSDTSFACVSLLKQMCPSWRTSQIQSVSQGHWTTLPASFRPQKTRRTTSSTRLRGKWSTSGWVAFVVKVKNSLNILDCSATVGQKYHWKGVQTDQELWNLEQQTSLIVKRRTIFGFSLHPN